MSVSEFKPALIVVDLQEDFLPPSGSLAIKDGRSVISPIIHLIQQHQWSTIIMTKDWHPQNHTSFASNHSGKAAYEELEFRHPLNELDPSTGEVAIKKQILWPDHCVQETKGSEFAEEFIPIYNDLAKLKKVPTSLVKKGYLVDREYYSCFQDTWGIHKTELDTLLTELAITDVFVVGLAYDFCVLNSAIDSSKLGYKTYVIKDCSRSVYPENDAETDSSYLANGVKIISMTDSSLSF